MRTPNTKVPHFRVQGGVDDYHGPSQTGVSVNQPEDGFYQDPAFEDTIDNGPSYEGMRRSKEDDEHLGPWQSELVKQVGQARDEDIVCHSPSLGTVLEYEAGNRGNNGPSYEGKVLEAVLAEGLLPPTTPYHPPPMGNHPPSSTTTTQTSTLDEDLELKEDDNRILEDDLEVSWLGTMTRMISLSLHSPLFRMTHPVHQSQGW